MIPGVILAAGLSTRMGGRPKAALDLDGHDTFLTRIVRTFHGAGVQDVVVVLGHGAADVEHSLRTRSLAPRVVINEQYRTGQFSSVLAALDAIDRPGVPAFLMTLVDVPLVSASTIRAVLERYQQTGAAIVRPVRGALHGHPVLIDRVLFDDLRHADPTQGAKPIVRANVSAAGDVVVDDDGAFADVDTPEDYRRLVKGGAYESPREG